MSYIDDRIIDMRCNQAYIKTIHAWVIKQSPLLDEQVCLSRVLNVLDSKNLPYSRKEVRTSFMRYYHQEFHGGATAYLNALCVNCSKKIVFPSKLLSSLKKAQGNKINAVAVTLETNKPHREEIIENSCPNTPKPKIKRIKGVFV